MVSVDKSGITGENGVLTFTAEAGYEPVCFAGNDGELIGKESFCLKKFFPAGVTFLFFLRIIWCKGKRDPEINKGGEKNGFQCNRCFRNGNALRK